ncbi:sulfite exporter TauE/SafE family protein [Sulfurospirillum diekertiae]|uniref:sulfite exporter TauE/SafE family protein n=1 Tax=Sulfurospirillum diekertiae TaxID=1854492 RepID=UPI0014277EC0|nr:sulfite exporter TauE/SafE family protein [Sulfurospirillum diekertiae]QIR78337.1 sulfite exporter TauE/SafE family protein [Sulfurospirillum diekertiae]
MNDFILGLITFLTSVLTGAVGMGGGLLLIAILPSFLPLNALIPVHGLTQISSNVSRAYFGHKDIQYSVVPKFLIGSLIGVGIFAFLLNLITINYIPLFIGTYILLSLWSQTFNEKIKKYESYYVIGFFQSGLSVVVGTTGPLAITKLLKEFEDNDKVVATSAVLMSITHILKALVYLNFGFIFADYLGMIFFMIACSILGSYVGTKLRNKIDGKKLFFALRIVLSIMALKSILSIFQ